MTPGPSRGAHILEAAHTVLARDGIVGLSVRSVAAAAGVSPAQVQYYFRTRIELIEAAFTHAGDQFLAGLREINTGEPSWARLRQLIWYWLPLDGERESRARVWLAYAATAATNDRIAAASALLDDELRAWLTAELQALERAAQVPLRPDAGSLAAQLLALIDGVTVQSLALPAERRHALAVQTIDPWLAGIRI
ncbi:TetR family transcriptional regulator [Frankia sp. Ag45/Mut15]|uniref:TetR family transcriptional regulator n=1 Tax=Frankia umida TaxID=573489 RepID=A0ABT0K5V5_9ACTN|nr:TetR family transcriptional regulator C-terminal domain-containing protein [Frankia umida]MCK9878688.1 TetR family transcriptional regulator [Frankia umida]